jgi:hypothetical protein
MILDHPTYPAAWPKVRAGISVRSYANYGWGAPEGGCAFRVDGVEYSPPPTLTRPTGRGL